MADLPIVVVFASQPVELQTRLFASYETCKLDCRYFQNDNNLNEILAQERPDVIISFGNREKYPNLKNAPYKVSHRWLHFETIPSTESELVNIGSMVFSFFLHRALVPQNASIINDPKPLISVFTPTFRTGKRIERAFRSLLNQNYDNWEWVILDDSEDNGLTLQNLKKIAKAESRVEIYSSSRRSGKIGHVKRQAASLSKGKILVELDHDDELTTTALSDILHSFQQNPEAGFAFSDWTEVDETSGLSRRYPEGWAFGYGSYRTENYAGKEFLVANAPPINAETIRHIVGAPNHVRAWKTDIYWQIGGHNPNFHVADDYELIIRTFLHTKMIYIPKLCYIQYLNTGSNTQVVRNGEIQRLVRYISSYYEPQIQSRLEQLGWSDPIREKNFTPIF